MSLKNCVLEDSRLDFGGSGPRFWRLQASIFEPPSQHASEKTIFPQRGVSMEFNRATAVSITHIFGHCRRSNNRTMKLDIFRLGNFFLLILCVSMFVFCHAILYVSIVRRRTLNTKAYHCYIKSIGFIEPGALQPSGLSLALPASVAY